MSDSFTKIIKTTNIPIIVIAGPGTGKTEAIIRKVNYLISKKGFAEESVLGITFTEKAASEMQKRALVKFNIDANFMTFHSLAYNELCDFYGIDIKILEEPLGVLFIKEFIKNNNLETIDLSRVVDNIAQDAYSFIHKLKEHGITKEKLDLVNFVEPSLKNDFIKIFNAYEAFKTDKRLYDYVDLLIEFRNLLKKNKKFKDKISSKYKYVLVDEFQDTNDIQLEILRYVTNNNITIVGDPKQAIYRFRGAISSCFDKFMSLFPNSEVVFLSTSYRLPDKIALKVNSLIENNDEKLSSLKSGGLVEGIVCSDETATKEMIIKAIKENPNKSIGIICRTNNDCETISRYLYKCGIEHFSSSSLLKNNYMVKKLINYLKIIYYDDNDIEYFKLIEDFVKDRNEIKKLLGKLGKHYFSRLLQNEEDGYEGLVELTKQIYNIKKNVQSKSLSDVIYDIIYKLGLLKEAISIGDRKGVLFLNYLLDSADNLSNIFNDSIYFFLNFIEFAKEIEIDFINKQDVFVEVLTFHKAKGKEFDIVIMPFLNERRLPSILRKNRFDNHFKKDMNSHLKEEKNLFFVGLSRAKEKLVLSYVRRFKGNLYNSKPSRFLEPLKIDFKEYASSLETASNFIEDVVSLLKHGDFKGAINRIVLEEKKEGQHILTVNKRANSLILSPSKIDTYLSCPRKYLYLYEYKIPTPEKYFFAFGKSFHKVLEKLIKEIYMTNYEFKDYYSKFVKLLRSYWIEEGYESREQMREYFEKAIKVADEIIKRELKRKNERKLLKVERNISLSFKELDIVINGIVDRVDEAQDGLEIIDYKTSKSMKSREDLKEDVQLYVYKEAVERLFRKKVSKVVLWYVLNDNYVEVLADEIYEETVKKKIKKVVDGIRKEDFKCKPSFMCNFCEFKDICKRED